MNRIIQAIFKNRKPDYSALTGYGFTLSDGKYLFTTDISDGQFKLNVKIDGDCVDAEVIDKLTEEAYTLFLAEGACGSFVGEVRAAYESVLHDIAEKCFDLCVFRSEIAQKIIAYVGQKYGDRLEFLWEKFSENAVWRRKDNRKWYGILMIVTADKLGLPSSEREEIIDLRADEKTIERLVDGAKFFKGYHMNKKSWITVRLDGSVPLETILEMLDESYISANRK